MTLTPDEIAQIVTALVTLMGILALYLKQQINHAETTAATKATNEKVDAQTVVINGQAAHVEAAAAALEVAARTATAQNQQTQNQIASAAPLPAPRPGDPR